MAQDADIPPGRAPEEPASAKESHDVAPPPPRDRIIRMARRSGRWALRLFSGALWLWSIAALWHFPAWPDWFCVLSALGWLAGSIALFLRLPPERIPHAMLAAFLLVRFVWGFNSPSNDRDWQELSRTLPAAEFDGQRVRIRNVRNVAWRTETDFDLKWEEREYDLDQIQRADFIVVPFALGRALAHVFVSFGFEDGEQIAISVEIRKERNESYSPIRGMFRHYEITYVIGDEKDLIGLRANVWKEPVHLYPIKATPEQARAMFVDMLRRANRLAARPRFYNTLLHNCTTAVVEHANELRENKIGLWNWRIVLPGFSDGLVHELDLLDFNGTLEEARIRFLINDRAAFIPDSREWSRQIRQTQGPLSD